jgi:hypothetical protein
MGLTRALTLQLLSTVNLSFTQKREVRKVLTSHNFHLFRSISMTEAQRSSASKNFIAGANFYIYEWILKRSSLTRDFRLQVFFMISVPRAPAYSKWVRVEFRVSFKDTYECSFFTSLETVETGKYSQALR